MGQLSAMIITDQSWARDVVREIVEFEYQGRSMSPDQERVAVECLNYSGAKGLKKFLDRTLGPARSAGPVADLPTART